MSKFVTTQAQLEELAVELEGSRVLAIDTEFMREKTYYAKLCLLQLNNGTVSALVDPLAVSDLSPLVPILTDENCVKIFHAGTQDIAILYHETGITPSPVFDTQVAASLLGHPLQVGYGPLVRSVCDVKLAKADSYTDWFKRPLTNSQVKYALDDVVYLPRVYERLRDELAEKGRLTWCEHDFVTLADPASYDVDPRETWRRVKRISSLSRGQLAVAREVAAWRESEAQRRNLPRKWVLPDEAVVEIARKAPKTREALFEVRGLANKLSGRDVNHILEAVSRGKEMPQAQWPKLERSPKGRCRGRWCCRAALLLARGARKAKWRGCSSNRQRIPSYPSSCVGIAKASRSWRDGATKSWVVSSLICSKVASRSTWMAVRSRWRCARRSISK